MGTAPVHQLMGVARIAVGRIAQTIRPARKRLRNAILIHMDSATTAR